MHDIVATHNESSCWVGLSLAFLTEKKSSMTNYYLSICYCPRLPVTKIGMWEMIMMFFWYNNNSNLCIFSVLSLQLNNARQGLKESTWNNFLSIFLFNLLANKETWRENWALQRKQRYFFYWLILDWQWRILTNVVMDNLFILKPKI